eukprot:jgi/Mesvir1/16916/Mv15779-RA.3
MGNTKNWANLQTFEEVARDLKESLERVNRRIEAMERTGAARDAHHNARHHAFPGGGIPAGLRTQEVNPLLAGSVTDRSNGHAHHANHNRQPRSAHSVAETFRHLPSGKFPDCASPPPRDASPPPTGGKPGSATTGGHRPQPPGPSQPRAQSSGRADQRPIVPGAWDNNRLGATGSGGSSNAWEQSRGSGRGRTSPNGGRGTLGSRGGDGRKDQHGSPEGHGGGRVSPGRGRLDAMPAMPGIEEGLSSSDGEGWRLDIGGAGGGGTSNVSLELARLMNWEVADKLDLTHLTSPEDFNREVRRRVRVWLEQAEKKLRHKLRKKYKPLMEEEIRSLNERFPASLEADRGGWENGTSSFRSTYERFIKLARKNIQRKIDTEVEKMKMGDWSEKNVLAWMTHHYREQLKERKAELRREQQRETEAFMRRERLLSLRNTNLDGTTGSNGRSSRLRQAADQDVTSMGPAQPSGAMPSPRGGLVSAGGDMGARASEHGANGRGQAGARSSVSGASAGAEGPSDLVGDWSRGVKPETQ